MSNKENEPVAVDGDTASIVPDDEFDTPNETVSADAEAEFTVETAPIAAATLNDAAPRRSIWGLLGWLVLLALILSLAGAAYYWYQHTYQSDLERLRGEVTGVASAQSTVSTLVDEKLATVQSDATSTVASTAASIDELKARIDESVTQQAGLQRSVSALYEKESQTSVDWVLAEAEYLVLAATQRLALERDVDTAIAALRAADQRLRSADHPDLIPIRDQVNKDVTALEAVNEPDIEGLAIYLANTIGQVDALPTKQISQDVTPFESVRGGDFKAEDWRLLGNAIWSDLVDLVEVKDADLPDSVLFDPELKYFLQQNLRLELASARLSVLRRDQANLQASVGLIKRQVESYYDANDAAVVSLIKRLDEATAMELAPSLPNITGSLDSIRKRRGESDSNQGSTP